MIFANFDRGEGKDENPMLKVSEVTLLFLDLKLFMCFRAIIKKQ